jgi:23S rRNA pseudouridine1911/1915/1917 synthase
MSTALPVIYEDEHILAIDKPAGIAVHKVSPTDPQETIADILVKERPYLADVGDHVKGALSHNLRPGIVHRLDKETSGIMLIAKDQPTFEYLKDQFQQRLVTKHYLALVYGHPKENRGTIDITLGKLGTKQTTQLKGKKELVEREAVTDYETIKTYTGFTLLEVLPRTGRTHQIRVHLKAIGCPIVGDVLYAKGKPMPPGLDRMFLHAQEIEFTAPNGTRLALGAPLPPDLQKVLDMLK